jgi:hypothetical protein
MTLREASVPLDGEHYLDWIAEQLDAGTSEDEIIAGLRRFNKNHHPTKSLRKHISDARLRGKGSSKGS